MSKSTTPTQVKRHKRYKINVQLQNKSKGSIKVTKDSVQFDVDDVGENQFLLLSDLTRQVTNIQEKLNPRALISDGMIFAYVLTFLALATGLLSYAMFASLHSQSITNQEQITEVSQ